MKKKQEHLTTEQLIEQSRKKIEWENKMKFIKEKFYPALCEATSSIEDATQNLTIINSVIMEKFLTRMKTVTMKDIDIYTNLTPSDPQYEGLKKMLELFDEMSVFDAKELFEGMKAEISLFLGEEQKERKLEDLKVRWIDEK